MNRVRVEVVEVKGKCAAGYKPGDAFIVDWSYLPSNQNVKICLHALNSMLTLLTPFIKGTSAVTLGIGSRDDEGYLQCPDPGKPYTDGGTVVFKLKREPLQANVMSVA